LLVTVRIVLVDQPLILKRCANRFMFLDVLVQSLLYCDTTAVLLPIDVQVRNGRTVVLKTQLSTVRRLQIVTNSIERFPSAVLLSQMHVVCRLLTL